MPLSRQRAYYSPHRLRLRARQLLENTSRFFSLLLPRRDADTDDIDVPDCVFVNHKTGIGDADVFPYERAHAASGLVKVSWTEK